MLYNKHEVIKEAQEPNEVEKLLLEELGFNENIAGRSLQDKAKLLGYLHQAHVLRRARMEADPEQVLRDTENPNGLYNYTTQEIKATKEFMREFEREDGTKLTEQEIGKLLDKGLLADPLLPGIAPTEFDPNPRLNDIKDLADKNPADLTFAEYERLTDSFIAIRKARNEPKA